MTDTENVDVATPANPGRTQDGRFAPGYSGNPAGMKKGTRHHVSRMLEKMMADDAEAVMRSVIQAAQNGDNTAAKIIIDRVAPARKDATIEFPLPKLENAKDAAMAMGEVVAAVSEGELSPDEGQAVAKLLEGYARLTELTELEARIRALEEASQK